MTDEPIVAIEIGTSKVCAMVGEAHRDDSIMITGVGSCESFGVRMCVITDLGEVGKRVTKAIQGAEESANVEIGKAYLVISGGHIQGVVSRGNVAVADPDRGIGEDDVESVRRIAGALNLSHDRAIMHTITQKFYVDGHGGVVNPRGMKGNVLALDMLVLHGLTNLMSNAVKVAQNVGVEIVDVAFGGLCSALATLTREQKECGALQIDLGGGATSYVAYADSAIALAGSLAVGGDHVTSDISRGLSLSINRAETLKKEAGSAVVDPGSQDRTVTVPEEVGFLRNTVTLHDLDTIIHARMEELLQLIRAELERKNLLHSMGAGVILTGGGARLKGLRDLAERVFGMPCSIGRPRDVSGASSMYEGPEFAALVGMIRYAFRAAKRPARHGGFGGILDALFGRLY